VATVPAASTAAGGTRPGGQRDFWLLWSGHTVSQVGSQITLIVLPLVAVLTLDAGGLQVGLLQAAFTLPYLLLPLPVGVWLDRRTLRPVLIGTDLLLAALVLSVPLAAALDSLTLTHLYVAALLGGSATVAADIAKTSYVPGLVGPERLAGANSKLNASLALGVTSGPGFGGGLAGWLGAPFALVADGVSYLLDAVLLSLLRYEEAPRPRTRDRAPVAEVRAGLRAVFGVPPIRALALHATGYNGGLQLVAVALLVHVVTDRGYGAAAYGLIAVAGGVGAVLGSLLAPVLGRRFGHGRVMLVALLVGANAFWLLPAAGGSRAAAVATCSAALFLASAASGLGGVVAVTVRQLLTPPELYARMNASYRLLTFGPIPLGALAGGLLVATIGARETLLVAPVVLLLAVLPLATRPVRELGRNLPSAPAGGTSR
jgi:MFS family permease